MLNPFKQPELIKAEVFMRMPDTFRQKQRTAWSEANRQGAEVECFLEGPSFDRAGNLFFPARRCSPIGSGTCQFLLVLG